MNIFAEKESLIKNTYEWDKSCIFEWDASNGPL